MARNKIAAAHNVFPVALLACGLMVRVWMAHLMFLNPDEALHYALAAQPSLAAAYHASLTTVHPPLYILLLHEWEWLGRSELFLRLLSVFAGVGFCWIMYRWVRAVQDNETAIVCLSLLLFLPALVDLSAELRQYALLLLFASAALCFFDDAIQRNSWRMMLCSAMSLWLALLTHYSAFLFALALGIYALTRLLSFDTDRSVFLTWAAGQVGALAVGAFLYVTHISRIQSAGTTQGIADTWLREWIFHRRQGHVLMFASHSTLRLFRYLFSNGAVGVLGLVLLIWSLAWLLKPSVDTKRNTWQLAILLSIPFALTFAAAMVGKYPYGGTRHDAVLAVFAIPAVSIGFRHLPGNKILKTILLTIGLLVCNVFAVPSPPNMALKDQKKANMEQAMASLRKPAPRGSIVFADHSAALLLSYYFCQHTVVPFEPLAQEFLSSDCDGYKLITPGRQPWGFQTSKLSAQLEVVQEENGLPANSPIWLVQAGWINSRDPDWLAVLAASGCRDPERFGENILICPLRTGGSQGRFVDRNVP